MKPIHYIAWLTMLSAVAVATTLVYLQNKEVIKYVKDTNVIMKELKPYVLDVSKYQTEQTRKQGELEGQIDVLFEGLDAKQNK